MWYDENEKGMWWDGGGTHVSVCCEEWEWGGGRRQTRLGSH